MIILQMNAFAVHFQLVTELRSVIGGNLKLGRLSN